MSNPLSKIPFLAFLIPLLAGIVLQYYFDIHYWSIAFILLGIIGMLFSYFISNDKQYLWRWLFGAGVFTIILGIGIFSTCYRQSLTEFAFEDDSKVYRGVVRDIPQEKPKSLAYKVYLPDENKQIVCYFQLDSLNRQLNLGEEFLFFAKIQPFKDMGNPDDFDYVSYMHNQGFAGSAYIQSYSWQSTGKESSSLKIKALECRQKILQFYRSLGFDETEFAILSALTLGYKDALTDDLKQSFRTTGTVHVLSVSGLHVGIIYALIAFLLGFIHRSSKYYRLKPILIILLLWIYAFITGLPPSVVRASIMLTVFCASEIFNRKSYSVHALYIAAFFMLLYNPLSLFDIGFQLSFLSVLSILYLQPKASALLDMKNRYLRYVWQMFTLSLVAQLATFPLCLYYFGTFPTYFFVANLLIVPLVGLIVYAFGGIIIAKIGSLLLSQFSDYLYYLPVNILKLLVKLMTAIVKFFERLPFALIDDVKVSFLDLVLIITLILGSIFFVINKKAKPLVVSLASMLILLSINLYNSLYPEPDDLIVYNRGGLTEIILKFNSQEYAFGKDDYRFLKLGHQQILIVAKDIWQEKYVEDRLRLDHLILTKDNTLSLYSLMELYNPKMVVIDASLSVRTTYRLTKECQKLGIPCHDVAQKGAYRINF